MNDVSFVPATNAATSGAGPAMFVPPSPTLDSFAQHALARDGDDLHLDDDVEGEEVDADPFNHFDCPQLEYALRYQQAKNRTWMLLDCSDQAIQLIHPSLRAGMRIRTRTPGKLPIGSTVLGVANGFLWRHEDGTNGASAFAARCKEDLDGYYSMEVLHDERHVKFPMSHVLTGPRSDGSEGRGRLLDLNKTNEALLGHLAHLHERKVHRRWFPTRTGNVHFEYAPEEDGDLATPSFMLKQKVAADIKAQLFGHHKQPFLYFSPLLAREASKNTRPLFPMLCEYDISPHALSPFKVEHGQSLLLTTPGLPRSGRVLTVIGTLNNRLCLQEDGDFPVEFDIAHHPLAKYNPVLLPQPSSLSKAAIAPYPTPQLVAIEPEDDAPDDEEAEVKHVLRPASVTCCGQSFFAEPSHLFYTFGVLSMMHVLHRGGPRRGTSGVILGTSEEGGAELWEYNETEKRVVAFFGEEKSSLDTVHDLHLIGFRFQGSLLDPPKPPPPKKGRKKGPLSMFKPEEAGTTASGHSDAVELPADSRKYFADTTHLVTLVSFKCSTLAAIGGNASPPQLSPRIRARTRSITPQAATLSPLEEVVNTEWLPLDTRWSSLLPFGLGTHGQCVQQLSGSHFGAVGSVLGVHRGVLYVLFDTKRGGEPISESAARNLRALWDWTPRPIFSSPTERSKAHGQSLTLPSITGRYVTVDASYEATWRFGHACGQRVFLAPREQLQNCCVDPLEERRNGGGDRGAGGPWRQGVVAGVFEGELFVYMRDTLVAEPLKGQCQGDIGSNYVLAVYDFTNELGNGEDHLLPVGEDSYRSLSHNRAIPELHHLRLFKVAAKNEVENSSSGPTTALVDCSDDAFRQLGSPLRFGTRIRQQVRIDPVPLAGHKWRCYGPDLWVTIIGVSDGVILACADQDNRFLRPFVEHEGSEVILPSSCDYVPPPPLPRAFLPSFTCTKSFDESQSAFLEIQKQFGDSNEKFDRRSPKSKARSMMAALKRSQSNNGARSAEEVESDGLPVITPFTVRGVLCDNAQVRELVRTSVSEADGREVRLLCEMLPVQELLGIMQWVLDSYGVHLEDGESITFAFRLVAGVIRSIPPGTFTLPTTEQWCLHQRERLVTREIGNREYAECLEKQEREKLKFMEKTRAERLRSIFEEDDVEDEHIDEDENHWHLDSGIEKPTDDGEGSVSSPALSRTGSFGGSASSIKRMSRKSAGNAKFFSNKWRRLINPTVFDNVVGTQFLPTCLKAKLSSTSGFNLLAATAVKERVDSPTSPTRLSSAQRSRATAFVNDDLPVVRPTNALSSTMNDALTAMAFSRLEQLNSINSKWPMQYVLERGKCISFDISVEGCKPFGLYHGQQFEVTSGDLAGEVFTILGVYKRQLWRYSDTAEAMPFEGKDVKGIFQQHKMIFTNVFAHENVRRADPFVFSSWKGDLLVLDVTESATARFGVSFGQRFAVLGRRYANLFVCNVDDGSPPPHLLLQPPVLVILGVCDSNKLWVAPAHGKGGARPFSVTGGRTIIEDWDLVYLYHGPVVPVVTIPLSSANHEDATQSQHGQPTTSSPATPAAPSAPEELDEGPTALLPIDRRRKAFRFRVKSGEIYTFDISEEACKVFGVHSGDRVMYRKPQKLCGKIFVVLGVREKRLWKIDERDSFATVLPNCRSAKDVEKEYSLKVAGHVTVKEFIG